MVSKIRNKAIIGYKSVTDKLKSGNGDCQWKVGEWKKHKGELSMCHSGFHASLHPYDVLNYLQGARFFLIEARGEVIHRDDKFVAKEMRLKVEVKDLKRLSVEFSIWCAKRCLPNFEKKYPKDTRVRKAIEAAEKWLKAKTDTERSAAESAASAARSAAWSAASAAYSAAKSAASAADSAAWSAASAADSAAWSAASAAWSAAWSAASAASAARSATESATRKKFAQLCKKYQEKRK